MANWFCSVFVVCRKHLSSPHCRSELIGSVWGVTVPGRKCIKKTLPVRTYVFRQNVVNVPQPTTLLYVQEVEGE